MMERKPISLLLLFLLSVIAVSASSNKMVRFELIHRHAHDELINKLPKTQLQRIKELLHSDGIRHQIISHKQHARRKAWETPSIEMPMGSGAAYRAGQYFVGIRVGTPPQKFTLIADTGSELTWMKCKHKCGDKCMQKRRGRGFNYRRVFLADNSSTFSTVPCSSPMCKSDLMNLFSLVRCPTPLSPCAYDYRYADGSDALGIFAKETVTVRLSEGGRTKVKNVLVGCSESFTGQSFEAADGVLGLGYGNHSFAMKGTQDFGGKFSYCLVDHLSPKNVSNYLTFGSCIRTKSASISPNTVQFTQLLVGYIPSLYGVSIKGISVGGVMLKIPPYVWDINNGQGGSVVDSGTSLTVLTLPAYQPVMSALIPPLKKFKKLDLEIGPLEYCFNSTGFDESVVPKLSIHFADGAKLEPPVKSYVIATADGVKCLGFMSATWPGLSVIGNIMQQNHLWEFDLVQNKLGFAPSTCA